MAKYIKTEEGYKAGFENIFMAQEIAETAQSTAETAQQIAETAQSTAETAQATANIQVDWMQTDSSAVDYIKNNPINLYWNVMTPTIEDSELLDAETMPADLEAILSNYPNRKFYNAGYIYLATNIKPKADDIERLLYTSNICTRGRTESGSIIVNDYLTDNMSLDLYADGASKFRFAVIYVDELPMAVIKTYKASNSVVYQVNVYLYYNDDDDKVVQFEYAPIGVNRYKGSLFPSHHGKKLLYKGDAVPVPSTATVGQTIVVKVVDENGAPTEWECVDISSPIDYDWHEFTGFYAANIPGKNGINIFDPSALNTLLGDINKVLYCPSQTYSKSYYDRIVTNFLALVDSGHISAPFNFLYANDKNNITTYEYCFCNYIPAIGMLILHRGDDAIGSITYNGETIANTVFPDTALSVSAKPADAKAVGDALAQKSQVQFITWEADD